MVNQTHHATSSQSDCRTVGRGPPPRERAVRRGGSEGWLRPRLCREAPAAMGRLAEGGGGGGGGCGSGGGGLMCLSWRRRRRAEQRVLLPKWPHDLRGCRPPRLCRCLGERGRLERRRMGDVCLLQLQRAKVFFQRGRLAGAARLLS